MSSRNPLLTPLRHRGVTLLGLALLTLVLSFGLPYLEIDSGFSSLVSDDNPDKKAYQQVVQEFGSDSRTLIYIRDRELWSPNKLASLRTLHDRLIQLPGVHHVDDIFTVTSIDGGDDSVVVGRLISKQPTEQSEVAHIRARAMNNPLLVGNILSRDGYATAVVLSLDGEAEHISDAEISHAIDKLLSPMKQQFQQLFQVGDARINADLHDLLIKDLSWLTPLSALVLIVVIMLMLHSFTAAIIPLISAALSLLWTMGIMGWIGLPLNILCAMLPSLVIVIGSTEDNHMVSSYLRALRSDSSTPQLTAATTMLQEIGVPMVLTITTTLIGFASNIFTGMELIRNFAFAAAIAIAANGVITMLLVPIILSWFGPKRSALAESGGDQRGLPGVLVRLFYHANQHYPKLVLASTAMLSALFVWQAMALKVTNNPISYFQQDNPIISQSATLHRDLAGVNIFYVVLTSKQPLAFQHPDNVEKLVEIQRFIDEQKLFDRTTSLADYLSLVNRAFHGGDPRFAKPPRSAQLTAQYLLFLHRNSLRGLVSYDYQRAIITVRHNISDSATINSYIDELRRAATDIAGAGIKVQLLGEGVMINGNAEQLMRDQVKSLTVLLLAIFLLMSLMFTSIKGGLISLIPNVIPIVIMFGIMGMLNIPLNPGTAMVAVIVMGIAIDNTIHMLTRYNDLSR
ncbi:MAG: efflux RND transporter permease subunit, partial [Mariprofundales bacterium]|nr:efflux RND transporter permease subunit [Mariprofundales bacterium]